MLLWWDILFWKSPNMFFEKIQKDDLRSLPEP